MNRTIEILTDQRDVLGEGALWDDRSATFWRTDILENAIYQFDPTSELQQRHAIGSMVGTIGLTQSDRLLLATANGFAFYTPASGLLEPIVDPEAAKQGNRFNDGKPGPSGEMWAGTMDMDAALGAGSLYRLLPDHRVQQMLDGLAIPNGLAWNSAETILYHIDTPTMQIFAFDYDKATASIANRRVVVNIPEAAGSPDGMTIDSKDNLWVAHWGGSAVRCWDPQNDRMLDEILLPAKQISCCTFGGPDFDELYVTSARVGLDSAELSQRPTNGAQFRIRLAIGGRPAYRFNA